jgi:hypothetical protein
MTCEPFHTGCVLPQVPGFPGVILRHSAAASQVYLGCPTIAILPDGDCLAAHSFFGPATTSDTTWLYRSRDRGASWQRECRISGQFWSGLFVHRGLVYLMGVNRAAGDVIIRCGGRDGRKWTEPVDSRSGVLLTGARYHSAPVPVAVHGGRIFRAFEELRGEWGPGFATFVLSAPERADLLSADSWTASNVLPWQLRPPFGGWLEGNMVVTPDGRCANILRVEGGTAAIVSVSDDGRRIAFDPASGFIDFPGGCKKFTIRRDPEAETYYALTNWIPPSQLGGDAERTRNTLALIASQDLRSWQVQSVILHHPDRDRTGFQYVDWQFDGPDLICVTRMAFDDGLGGAHNCHDANYIAFLRIPDYRQRTSADMPLFGAMPGSSCGVSEASGSRGRRDRLKGYGNT